MDFSSLFIVAVLNALMTCWTFRKGEVQTANGSFSIPRFIFHSYNLISHHSLPQERKIRFSYRINHMKTRNDHGETSTFLMLNLQLYEPIKLPLRNFRFILKHGSWILCIVKPLLDKLGLEIEKQCQCMK